MNLNKTWLAAIFLLTWNTVFAVDLSEDEVVSVKSDSSNLSARPWYERTTISGFAAAGFISTGKDAAHPNGKFHMKEASLFIDSQLTKNSIFFYEYQFLRIAAEDKPAGQSGEIYLQQRNIFTSNGVEMLGAKMGRIDIPFGEEYLSQDSIDNPLINFSSPYAYGFDEGVAFYGNINKLQWILAIMDGSDDRTEDDHPSQAVSIKVSQNLNDNFKVSASYLENGKSAKSAFEFGGTHFVPLAGGSSMVEANAYAVDLVANFSSVKLWLEYGGANLIDDDSDFSRAFKFYTVEGLKQISNKLYFVLRYSAIGTFDDKEGYAFSGKPYFKGTTDFSGDMHSLTRTSVGFGYDINERLRAKFEIAQNEYKLIDSSVLEESEKHDFWGVEVAASF